MKKLLLFLISTFTVLSFNSCSNDDLMVNDKINQSSLSPTTTVDLYVSKSANNSSFATEPSTTRCFIDDNDNQSKIDEVYSNNIEQKNGDYSICNFYIRVDNSILGDGGNHATYPIYEEIGKYNKGVVDVSDNSLFTKISDNRPKSLYNPDGKIIETLLKKVPNENDVKEMLSKQGLNTNDNSKQAGVDTSKINLKDYKIIWFHLKWQTESKCKDKWHVDGVLVPKDYVSIFDINPESGWNSKVLEDVVGVKTEAFYTKNGWPKNVEVDIHQQKHCNWGQIKTSIHIRQANDEVKVTIPLFNAEPTDDFNLRIYKNTVPDIFVFNENEEKEYIHAFPETGEADSLKFFTEDKYIDKPIFVMDKAITTKVEHKDGKIIITITADRELIERIIARTYDGFTIEVNSYYEFGKDSDVWNDIKGSIVEVINPTVSNAKGQITSAIYNDATTFKNGINYKNILVEK
jgi:hypothetical protein